MITRVRVTVFIDRCYWHSCPQYFSMSATSLDYWNAKIGQNRERDAETTCRLEERGSLVLQFWDKEGPSYLAERVGEMVHAWEPTVSA